MQTMQQRRQRDAGLLPHGANPGGSGARHRAAADVVADAADHAMVDALASEMKDHVQQSGQ